MSVYLLHRFSRPGRVLRELDRLGEPPARYGWMRFLRAKLWLHLRRDYAVAEAEFARAARAAPGLMMARAYMAETSLCRGREARAWGVIDAAVARYGGRAGVEARAWRGAMRLWTGRYEEALADLTPTAAAGARFARAWRGGALAQLGRLEEAER